MLLSVFGTGLAFKVFPKVHCKSEQHRTYDKKVVSIFHPDVTDGTGNKDNANLKADIVKQMVLKGIEELGEEESLKKAWERIIPDKNKRIAIKVNCQIESIYTKAVVVNAIVDGLLLRGVSSDNIIVYNRTDNAFDYAGFHKNSESGIKIGTVAEFGGYSRLFYERLANLLLGG